MPRDRRNQADLAVVSGSDGLPSIVPVDRLDWVRFICHAFPGAGKTSLIGSGAELGIKTLIVRSSMDLIPKRVLTASQQYPGMIDQVICDTWEKMYEVLDYCRMTQEFPYQWVWWDNISVAQDVLLDDIWEGTVAVKPARAWIVDSQGRSTGKPNVSPASGLDRGEYGRNMERIQQWVRHMVGTNRFHFGIMAHPHEGQHPTNDEGGTLLRPYVQGKMMSEKICGYANLVGFMEVMEGDDQIWRRLHVRESSRWYAKDQYDAFPKGYIDNPTVGKLMKAITDSKQETPSRGRGRGATAGRGRGSRA